MNNYQHAATIAASAATGYKFQILTTTTNNRTNVTPTNDGDRCNQGNAQRHGPPDRTFRHLPARQTSKQSNSSIPQGKTRIYEHSGTHRHTNLWRQHLTHTKTDLSVSQKRTFLQRAAVTMRAMLVDECRCKQNGTAAVVGLRGRPLEFLV